MGQALNSIRSRRKLSLIVMCGVALAAAGVASRVRADSAPPSGKAAARPTPPTPEQKKKYKEALNRGRALQKKSDWAGAIAAFHQALTAIPNDATAWSEISQSALKKKDLKLAESAARKSVAFATEPKIRAASLYNLGRVQEERGEKPAAIESYSQSLRDRPNKTVRERLLTLDPKAAAALDPVAPKAMEGPFPSLQAWCKNNSDRAACEGNGEGGESGEGDEGEKPPEFSCNWNEPTKALDKAAAPYKAIRIFTTECSLRGGDLVNTDYYLAVKLASGWYIAGDTGHAFNSMKQTDGLTVDKLEVRDVVPGGAPEILVWTSTSSDYRGLDDTDSTWLSVAGVGASGKPSATSPILLSQEESHLDLESMNDEGEGNETKSGAKLKASFLPDGQLEIKGPFEKVGGGISAEQLAPVLGKHQLLFP